MRVKNEQNYIYHCIIFGRTILLTWLIDRIKNERWYFNDSKSFLVNFLWNLLKYSWPAVRHYIIFPFVVNRPDDQKKETQADLIVGCDGAFSAVRKQFLRQSRFNFSQTYIPHGYIELTMPPKDGDVRVPKMYFRTYPCTSALLFVWSPISLSLLSVYDEAQLFTHLAQKHFHDDRPAQLGKVIALFPAAWANLP